MSALRVALVTAVALSAVAVESRGRLQPTDLDAFMQQVMARRDDNWKKLQQYILDERETVDLRGASGTPLWGEQREYTWFIRDGYFVRSPVRFNGVTISEPDRRKYEEEYLARVERRDQRFGGPAAPGNTPSNGSADTPRDVNSLIRQTREPRFVSSAYFLRFKFDAGTYALVGHEQVEGRDTLRIEYYPTNLFSPGRRGPGRLGQNPVDTETRRLLNKVAVITLWIEPTSNQILKYTFENVDLDFLPAQWLVRVSDLHAIMTMGQPFPEVWLPRDVSVDVGLSLAIGSVGVKYQLAYENYRRADATSTVHLPPDR